MSEEFTEETKTAPTLTFGDAPKAEPDLPAAQEQAPVSEAFKKEAALTDEEQAQVDAFVEKIDLADSAAIMTYGVSTQKNLADFSEKAIEDVRTKDMGEVGDLLTGLVTELKNFDVDEKEKGIAAWFKKKKNSLDELKARYSKVETNVDTVTAQLEDHEQKLLKDSAILDKMYDLNLTYYKELTMYILAGKKKLEDVRATELPSLQAKATETGLPEDAQKAKDLAAQCERFDKKLYDLELTRTVAMQTAPQIRLIQNSDMQMAEKIQSTIVNTIPLWKNQMVIAIGMEHASEAARAEREVNDMTNELLKKNADKLHQVTVATAKENERGIVDIETLKHTNETLISAMDEIMTIQKDGREKRQAAEKELTGIEQQLHDKLLEMSKS
ncbi:MAG: toxic anion resistance protein [Lachnospiraceae bacterium]|nr:toxic anion resistance protein [Lachnospiraceae bacterium]